MPCDRPMNHLRSGEPPQMVPHVAVLNQTRGPSGRLFHINRNSSLLTLTALQIIDFEFFSVDETGQYVQLSTSYGGFLYKSFTDAHANVLTKQLEDQVLMGMWNPHIVNMDNVEEQYGKVVYFDVHDTQDHPHILKQLAIVSSSAAVIPTMTIDGVLMELPLATAEDYSREATPDDDLSLLWTYQIVAALKFCHEEKKIVHGDIRPRNIFVFHNGNHIKLGNFYYSSPVRLEHEQRSREQMLYSPPEVLPVSTPNDPPRQSLSRYGFSSDVYSLALCLYFFSHLRTPFDEIDDPAAQLRRLVEEGRRPPLRPNLTRPLKKVLEACWRTEKRDPAGGIIPLEPRRPAPTAILNYLDYN